MDVKFEDDGTLF